MPMSADTAGEIRHFFNEFVAAFAEFDGPLVAQRYAVPCIAVDAQGAVRAFHTAQEVGDYFQAVLTTYHDQGCRSCRFSDLQIVPMGTLSALASVSWELLRADGSVASGWRESYHLLRTGQGWRVVASTDHAD